MRLRRLVLIFVNPLYVFDGVQSLLSENSGDVRQASLPQNARTAQSQRSAQRKGRQQAGPNAKKRNPAP
ncbi:hypothetical protein EZZ76_03925 [Neisseria meningitidis]|nr:hypothetical protein [Neisseria meningitidis]